MPTKSSPASPQRSPPRRQIGTSLTQRGRVRSFAFVTPRVGEGEHASRWVAGTPGGRRRRHLHGRARSTGDRRGTGRCRTTPATPVAIVENASLPQSRVHYTTLEGLPAFAEHPFGGPTLLLIGPQFRARARQSAERDAVVQVPRRTGSGRTG